MNFSIKEIIYYFINRLPKTFLGKYVTCNIVKVHWGRGLNNFGDCLQPDTLRYYGLLPVYVPSLAKADIIMAGSILDMVPLDYSGYIIGTGGGARTNHFPNATIKAVRGELSKATLSPQINDLKLGDCGLLCKIVYPAMVKKIYKVGLIPHFVDTENDAVKHLKVTYGNALSIISPLGSPKKVIQQIKECECIISSSLHGLIVADCFGIPTRRWVDRQTQPLDNTEIKFDIKFLDYYSSLGIEEEPISLNGNETLEELQNLTNKKPQHIINKLISGLDEEMKLFSSIMRSRQ